MSEQVELCTKCGLHINKRFSSLHPCSEGTSHDFTVYTQSEVDKLLQEQRADLRDEAVIKRNKPPKYYGDQPEGFAAGYDEAFEVIDAILNAGKEKLDTPVSTSFNLNELLKGCPDVVDYLLWPDGKIEFLDSAGQTVKTISAVSEAGVKEK